MKHIKRMRRIALYVFLVSMGMILAGGLPGWVSYAAPIAAILWLMIYDELVMKIK